VAGVPGAVGVSGVSNASNVAGVVGVIDGAWRCVSGPRNFGREFMR
jgi:hypothetical protein